MRECHSPCNPYDFTPFRFLRVTTFTALCNLRTAARQADASRFGGGGEATIYQVPCSRLSHRIDSMGER
jgi:hypothetical protein